MRLTTHLPQTLLLSTLTVSAGACVGGLEDPCDRPGRGSASAQCAADDTDPTPSGDCKMVDAKEALSVITSMSDIQSLGAPSTGCWDYNGNLRIEGSAIASLDKLGELKAVNDLELVDTSLTKIDSKMPIIVYGSLTVSGNSQLTSLANLTVRKYTGAVDGGGEWLVSYAVRDNPKLANLDGLKGIKTVDGELQVTNNPLLTSVTFPELTSVPAGVRITNNGLTALDLGLVDNTGRIEVSNNTKLTTFTGPRAAAIKGELVLRGNSVLSTLSLSSITTIQGALTIDNNDALAGLDGLPVLDAVLGTITITNNNVLTNLGNLSHANGVASSTVNVSNNTAMSICAVVEFDGCTTSGSVTASGLQNAENCNCWCSNQASRHSHQYF